MVLVSRRVAAAAALAATILVLAPPAGAADSEPVEFDSAQLEGCVRSELGLFPPAPVTVAAMEGLTSLECVAVDSASLQALAAAKNLESLALPQAQSADWAALAALTALTTLDLSESNVTSLDWASGAEGLTDVTLDRTAVADWSALADIPLTRLSLRSMDLANIDFLAGHPSLSDLHFDDNEIDDIAVLQTLPSLSTVTFDSNRVVDVTRLATLPGLTQWSAKNERGTLPPIQACVQTSLTGGTDMDGTRYPLLALDVVTDTDSFVVPFNGTVTLVTRSGSSDFSARFEAEAYGHSAPCAWPDEYLPTIDFPTELTVGRMATIGVATWGTRQVAPAYRWTNADGTAAAVDASVVPLASAIGETATPSAITSAEGMQTITVTGPSLTIKGEHAADASFSFAEPPTVGAAPSLAPDRAWTSTTLTCTWLIDGVAVSTAANCGWVVPASAAAKKLSARVTVHRTNYVDKTYEVAPSTVMRAFAKASAGNIVGTPDVGKSLTVAPIETTAWSPTPTSRTYQWLRNGAAIPGATASTYALQSADAGRVISVEVTGHKAGYRSVTIETPSLTVRRIFTARPAPTIAGTLKVGSTLTAKAGTWSPTAALSYQWYRNGIKIAGATRSTYVTRTTDGGAKYAVRVTAKRSGYTTSSRTSATVTILKRLTSTPTPTISGTPRVKSTLTARPGVWGPGTVTLAYQWYRNGKAIPGATAKSYKPGVKDAFASFKVKVRGKKSGYYPVSRTSASITVSGITYATCAALLADYPGGVAKSATTPGIRATTYVSSKLYALNAGRDRDKDGWACE